MSPGNRETGGLPLFYPEGRIYSPPAKAGGGSPPVGRARALSERDCDSCGSRWTRLHFCQTASLAHAVGAGVFVLESPVHGVVYCHLIPPSACVNLPPAAWHRYMGGTICSTLVSVSSCRWQVDAGRRRDGVAIYHPMNRGFQSGNPCADCMGKAGSLAEMQPCPAAPAGAAIPLGLHPQVRFGGQPPQAALGPEMSARTRPTGGLPPPALAGGE